MTNMIVFDERAKKSSQIANEPAAAKDTTPLVIKPRWWTKGSQGGKKLAGFFETD